MTHILGYSPSHIDAHSRRDACVQTLGSIGILLVWGSVCLQTSKVSGRQHGLFRWASQFCKSKPFQLTIVVELLLHESKIARSDVHDGTSIMPRYCI